MSDGVPETVVEGSRRWLMSDGVPESVVEGCGGWERWEMGENDGCTEPSGARGQVVTDDLEALVCYW